MKLYSLNQDVQLRGLGMRPDSFVGFMIFRELMLISHRQSTEQLQEALRQKQLDDANWREKVTIMQLSSACV